MTNSTELQFFATTPKGLELLLVDELRELGATNPAEKLAGVTFTGDLATAYKACLWSRLANRILLRLTQVPASTPEQLYAGVQTILWDEHLAPTGSLHINFITSQSKITHSLYGAQKVKDAIVDQLRDKYDVRPNVVRDHPDISVHVYLHRDIATISLDLSGESLHKRGYRLEQGAAPLKENLAAAILLRAGWKKLAEQQMMLLDPMCGSGTFLIEAALMAGNIAPGLLRDYFGFLGWKQHAAELWQTLVQDAEKCRNPELIPTIVGYDEDPHAIKIAFANIERAGMRGKIHVEKCELSAMHPKQSPGLLVVNPPYGERLGDMPELPALYAELGSKLKQECAGWYAAVLTGSPELGKSMGLRSRKQYVLFNGAIPCQLLLFDVQPENFVDRSPEARNERRIRKAQKSLNERDQELAQMLANRIKKNLKNLQRWVDKEGVTCYRVYDADLPEYAISVDFYHDLVCVQEYQVPKSVDKHKAEQRLQQALSILPQALNVPETKIFFREQSTQLDSVSQLYSAKENKLTFLINLLDAYFEVGLPLEQRILRDYIQQRAAGKDFLNLFSFSGSMTMCAAAGGARTTQSITDSAMGDAWIKQNMQNNHFAGRYQFADIPEWVRKEKSRYDLIFAELPDSTFYLCQEHPELVRQICQLLAPNGELYVVTRDSRFKLDRASLHEFTVEDMSSQMLPYDFSRRPKAQQVWRIT